MLQKHFQRRQIRRVFPAGRCGKRIDVDARKIDFTRVFPGERLYVGITWDWACYGSRDPGEFSGGEGSV